MHHVDLVEHLLGRRRDQALDLARRGAGKRDEHVGERDVDLGFFFAGGDQHREQAQQQPDQGQQWRDLGRLEACRDAVQFVIAGADGLVVEAMREALEQPDGRVLDRGIMLDCEQAPP